MCMVLCRCCLRKWDHLFKATYRHHCWRLRSQCWTEPAPACWQYLLSIRYALAGMNGTRAMRYVKYVCMLVSSHPHLPCVSTCVLKTNEFVQQNTFFPHIWHHILLQSQCCMTATSALHGSDCLWKQSCTSCIAYNSLGYGSCTVCRSSHSAPVTVVLLAL